MSSPFLGQLQIVGFSFAPRGWAQAVGQLLPISQNTALFSLLGTNFGGDGKVTFGLPKMTDNVPIGAGAGPGLQDYVLGETGGVSNVTLLLSEMPRHTHSLLAGGAGRNISNDSAQPVGNAFFDAASGSNVYTSQAPNQSFSGQAVTFFGNGQPHNNMMPYLGLNFIIAMQGVFPPRQ